MVSNTINLFLQMMTAPAEDEDKPERRKDKMFGEEAEEDRHQDPAKLHAAAEHFRLLARPDETKFIIFSITSFTNSFSGYHTRTLENSFAPVFHS